MRVVINGVNMEKAENVETAKKNKSTSGVRYFLPSEVVLHNKPDDFWVSFLGKVCDITPLIKEYSRRKEIKPLLANAGKDISHWFDSRTKDIKYIIHPVTGLKVPYCPLGLIPHVHPQFPSTKWQPLEPVGLPWWKDPKYVIGLLSSNPRPLRAINCTVPETHRTNLVWVADEEKLYEILKRLAPHNSHLKSYTLKYQGEKLQMEKTLEENKILDERRKFTQLGMPENCYIPAIQLYYNDDLTT